MPQALWFIPVGLFVGTYGTIVGAGGGFILVPLLMLLFPDDPPAVVTAASLAVIVANSTSGTIAYARMRRISYRTGIFFALATIPGALLGSWLTALVPRRAFGAAFGVLLVGVAAFLAVTRARKEKPAAGPGANALPRTDRPVQPLVDTVVDRDGDSSPLSFSLPLGMVLSFFIGILSSLAGIGGGLIHVPVLTHLFGFPVHIATATSHFVLVFTSLAGLAVHVIDGTWPVHLARDLCLAVGVVGGAQLGAFLARRLASRWIILGLAAALGMVGVRLVAGAFF
jgi:uncharacterized protein